MTQEPEEKADAAAWRLFTELRKETVESQKLRTQFIGFKITFVSAAIGLIAANKLDELLFIIPAFAAIFFDFLIASYSFSIRRIGVYCKEVLEPVLKRFAGFLQWEECMQMRSFKQNIANVGNVGITILTLVPISIVLIRRLPSMLSITSLAVLLLLMLYDIKVSLFRKAPKIA